MKFHHWLAAGLFVSVLTGCTTEPSTSAPPPSVASTPEERLKENRARLSKEDQELVAAQDYCPVMPHVQLGAMGVPLKIKVKDQTVFVCCKSCLRRAEDSPDETLASLTELKKKAKDQKK